jgi:nucleoside-diphosphate-sugar epimerase
MPEVHAVTGPFSYTGRYIARELNERGVAVRGLVRRLPADGTAGIDCRLLQFSDPDRLSTDLEGANVLYNTYWIRFGRAGSSFRQAVLNTLILGRAAKRAGVRRIIHISVSNPRSRSSPSSPRCRPFR